MIGTLGRLDPNKRIDLVIEAAAPLLGDRCKLLIIGRGEESERLEGLAAKHGVAEHVIFGGYQADMTAMLSAFDLNLTASLQETFGLSVLEALANGLPVLYTTCPALDGISTDRARQVAGNVRALRAELAKEIEAGVRPRQPVIEVFDRYGIESVATRIDDLYERPGGPPPATSARAGPPAIDDHRRADPDVGPRPLRWISLWLPRGPIRTSSAGSACGVTSWCGACASTTSSWSR